MVKDQKKATAKKAKTHKAVAADKEGLAPEEMKKNKAPRKVRGGLL